MKIAGFKKQTLIDFPGYISSIVFTQACNFRCPYCHNPDLVLPEKFGKVYSEKQIFEYLEKYKKLLQAVSITGGEPTLHNDLPEFILRIKNLGLKTKLDTNGTNLVMLNSLIKNQLLDFIAMDIKHIPDFELYNKAVGQVLNNKLFNNILKSIELIKHSGIEYQFRTTVAKGLHSLEQINKLKKLFGENYIVQNIKPEVVLNPKIKLTAFDKSVLFKNSTKLF
jgi:pyruvate formate lyase activating enzyme